MKWKSFAGAALIVLAAVACQRTEEAEPAAGADATPSAVAQQAGTADTAAASGQTITTTDAVVDPDVAKLAIEEPIAVSITDSGVEVKGSPVPGATKFQVTNNGTQQHSLVIEGPGGKAQLAAPLQPLEVGTITLNLTPGTYRLYCPMEPETLTAKLEVEQPQS